MAWELLQSRDECLAAIRKAKAVYVYVDLGERHDDGIEGTLVQVTKTAAVEAVNAYLATGTHNGFLRAKWNPMTWSVILN